MPASTVALLAVDLLLIAAAFMAAVAIGIGGDPRPYVFEQGGWTSIAIVMATFVGGMYFHNLYSQVYIRSRVLLLEQLCIVAGIAFILEGLISYLSEELRIDIATMLWGGLIAITALFGWRLFFSGYSLEVLGLDRLLLIGEGPVISGLSNYIHANPQAGFVVAGHVEASAVSEEFSSGAFHRLVAESKPNRVVAGAQGGKAFAQELVELAFGGSPMEDASACYERVCGRLPAESDPLRLITTSELQVSGRSFLAQTVGHVLAAVVLIAGFLPFFLIGLLLTRLTRKGPLLQKRIYAGLRGRRFPLWKFRRDGTNSWADCFTLWFHLDAYLQLFWVISGRMALVGPRPEPEVFGETLSRWIPYFTMRHSVRPGITGWAQIKGMPHVEDAFLKLEYDLYYAKYQSMTLDVVILAQALKSALFLQKEPARPAA